ncbi:hypothetical protein HNP55_001440 [Paucibacter oligotrophus]|uniref:T4 bacteriophage base plate protein n=1 Tax=Roseateles oligotrophus TaxID=1769250 RepID=A0A840L8A3_9BURK|nr:hypothetical protein [Roseateles oligotrophus]MBB4842925.1 hypothetical protein [Roseateles oligotrophus]
MLDNSALLGARLLDLWEQAGRASAERREDLLLAFGQDANLDLPQGLGERNKALLALRTRLLGPHIALQADCPHCASELEFELDCPALLAQLGEPEPDIPQCLEVDSYRLQFRRPCIDDVRASAKQDAAEFSRLLLQRCILDYQAPDDSPMPEALSTALAQRLEQLDPAAQLSLALQCPDCARPWSAPLAPAALLWQELRAEAERLLAEVAALAQAYGWSEEHILAMSPQRRGHYLQLSSGVLA